MKVAVHNTISRSPAPINYLPEQVSFRWFKYGIWLYFFLLIFEGALRKWILPGLATPLLIVRDPFALVMVLSAWNKGLINKNFYVVSIVLISLVSFFTAILLGHGNVVVALYGLRILLIHFPLTFIIGKVFTHDDVVKIGRAVLWISIPMVILTGLQFYSPQSAWVNRGVGGDEAGAGFSGALGYFRPPGTFSFTNGVSLFFSFTAFYIFYFWANPIYINRLALIGATIALLFSIPLSISRSLFFSVVVALGFMVLSLSRKPQYFSKIASAILVMLVLIAILSQTSSFQTATAAFTDRFTTANDVEGGLQGVIGDRYFGGMIGAIQSSGELPFFGLGLGMGTNAGATLLTGKVMFLISEGEWGRLIGEMGLLLGLLVILIRVGFSIQLLNLAVKQMSRGDILPWMLLGFGLTVIPQGQWAQPTALGFSTLIGGLIIASLNKPRPLLN